MRVDNAQSIANAESVSVAFWFKGSATGQNQSDRYQSLLVIGNGPTEGLPDVSKFTGRTPAMVADCILKYAEITAKLLMSRQVTRDKGKQICWTITGIIWRLPMTVMHVV